MTTRRWALPFFVLVAMAPAFGHSQGRPATPDEDAPGSAASLPDALSRMRTAARTIRSSKSSHTEVRLAALELHHQLDRFTASATPYPELAVRTDDLRPLVDDIGDAVEDEDLDGAQDLANDLLTQLHFFDALVHREAG